MHDINIQNMGAKSKYFGQFFKENMNYLFSAKKL